MNEYLSTWNALTLAEQFRAGAVLIACIFVLMLVAVFCGPVLLAGARDLFPDETLEDEEAKLVAARQRRRENQFRDGFRPTPPRHRPAVPAPTPPPGSKIPHCADTADERRLLEAIAHMSHPTNRIH